MGRPPPPFPPESRGEAPRQVVNKVHVEGTLQVGDSLYDDLLNYPYPAELVVKVESIGDMDYRDGDGNIKTRVLNLKLKKFEAV